MRFELGVVYQKREVKREGYEFRGKILKRDGRRERYDHSTKHEIYLMKKLEFGRITPVEYYNLQTGEHWKAVEGDEDG